MNRLVLGLLIVLVTAGPALALGDSKPANFRVVLNSGARFVLRSAVLTSDALVGTGSNGRERAVPISDIRSLQRGNGTYARTGAALGALIGSAILILNFVESKDTGPDRSSWEASEKIPLELIGIIGGSTLVGAGIGCSIDRWESVSPGFAFGSLTDRKGWRVQLALSF